jgi:tetratricopeptide (TPR) repeat protein
MSFALSNLGDFEGALRATKRALELDPYYVPQKLALAIDVEYEDPELAVAPSLSGTDERLTEGVADFDVDQKTLDTLFTELAPTPAATPATSRAVSADMEQAPYAMASDYLSKGLFDRASAEIARAMARGAPRGDGLVLLGEVYARQGLHGEALERFREARRDQSGHLAAALGEGWALIRLGRAREALPLAQALVRTSPEEVDYLLLAAISYADSGDPAAALSVLEVARRVAPMRADVQQTIGDIARSLGDSERAIASYRHALQLDPGFALVRFRLAQVLESRNLLRDAEAELEAALQNVPTFIEATLALASLRRRLGRPADALTLLIDLLKRDPYHLDGLTSLGETLLDLNRRGDASVAFARVLRFDPDHVGALYHQGAALAEQKRYDEAITTWQRLIDLAPAGAYAKRARREMRTATDLKRILGRGASRAD